MTHPLDRAYERVKPTTDPKELFAAGWKARSEYRLDMDDRSYDGGHSYRLFASLAVLIGTIISMFFAASMFSGSILPQNIPRAYGTEVVAVMCFFIGYKLWTKASGREKRSRNLFDRKWG